MWSLENEQHWTLSHRRNDLGGFETPTRRASGRSRPLPRGLSSRDSPTLPCPSIVHPTFSPWAKWPMGLRTSQGFMKRNDKKLSLFLAPHSSEMFNAFEECFHRKREILVKWLKENSHKLFLCHCGVADNLPGQLSLLSQCEEK